MRRNWRRIESQKNTEEYGDKESHVNRTANRKEQYSNRTASRKESNSRGAN